jgi:hypothetical protein
VAGKSKSASGKAVYDKRARLLKGAGVALSFKLSRGNSPQAKGAVTRAWKKYRVHLNPRKGTTPSKFVKTTKAEHRTVKKFYAPEAVTPGGFFVQPPKGVRASQYKVKVKGNRIEVRSPRKKVFDEIVALETTGFLRNPKKALAASLKGIKNIRQIQIMVNGFQGKNTYSLKDAALYMQHVLIPDLREEFEENGDRLTAKAVRDIFQLKVIHGAKRKKNRGG